MVGVKQRQALLGVFWILASCVTLSGVSVCSRALWHSVDPWQLSLVRSGVGFLAMLPIISRKGWASVATAKPSLHVTRALFLTAAMYCGFYGFTHLPLADATGLYFSRPLFIVAFAAVWLGQRIGWRRWMTVALGFIGMWLVMQPGSQGWRPDTWVPAAGAMLIAVAMLQVKRMQVTESDLAIVFYSNALGTLLALGPALGSWQSVDGWQAILLVGVGVLGVTSQVCMVKAYRVAEPATLAPVEYLQIPFTVVLAGLLFQEWPQLITVGGIALIVFAGWLATRQSIVSIRS